MPFGKRGLGTLQRRREGHRPFHARRSFTIASLLAPLRAACLARIVRGLPPPFETPVQRSGERGIGQRRKLLPAPGRIVGRHRGERLALRCHGGGVLARRLGRRRCLRRRRATQQLVEDGEPVVELPGRLQGAADRVLQCGGGALRCGRHDGARRIDRSSEIAALLRARRRGIAGGLEPRKGLARPAIPAFDRQRALGTLTRQRRQARLQVEELGALHIVQQRLVERLPGAVDLDQAVGRDQRFRRQRRSGVDQPPGLFARHASRRLRRKTLLEQTVNAAVVAAELALGQLERRFARNGADRRQLHVDGRILARQCQQGGVVALRSVELVTPIDVRRSNRGRSWCGGPAAVRGVGGRSAAVAGVVLVASPAQHGRGRVRNLQGSSRIVRRRARCRAAADRQSRTQITLRRWPAQASYDDA